MKTFYKKGDFGRGRQDGLDRVKVVNISLALWGRNQDNWIKIRIHRKSGILNQEMKGIQ